MDDLNEGNISASVGKQGWAELFHTRINIKLYQIILQYKIFWNTNFCSHKSKVFAILPLQKKDMKKAPPDNIFYFVHIALLNIYSSRGLCEFFAIFIRTTVS